MTDRPASIRRVDNYLDVAMITHEYIADRQQRLAQLGRTSERSVHLLRESARIALTEIPATLRDAVDLVDRWREQELLDPARAALTLRAVESNVQEVEPRVMALHARQREAAREMRLLLEQAQES